VAGISFSAWRGFPKKGKTDGAHLSTELACQPIRHLLG
jgi:hypothetical protein